MKTVAYLRVVHRSVDLARAPMPLNDIEYGGELVTVHHPLIAVDKLHEELIERTGFLVVASSEGLYPELR